MKKKIVKFLKDKRIKKFSNYILDAWTAIANLFVRASAIFIILLLGGVTFWRSAGINIDTSSSFDRKYPALTYSLVVIAITLAGAWVECDYVLKIADILLDKIVSKRKAALERRSALE